MERKHKKRPPQIEAEVFCIEIQALCGGVIKLHFPYKVDHRSAPEERRIAIKENA